MSQLFNTSKSSDPLSDDAFHEVVKQLGELSSLVHPGTHLEVQNCLNACSIFAGSNPLVSELINADCACWSDSVFMIAIITLSRKWLEWSSHQYLLIPQSQEHYL